MISMRKSRLHKNPYIERKMEHNALYNFKQKVHTNSTAVHSAASQQTACTLHVLSASLSRLVATFGVLIKNKFPVIYETEYTVSQ